MKILVINSGSSSVKYQFIDITSKKSIFKGMVEKINSKTPKFSNSIFRDGRWNVLDSQKIVVNDYRDIFCIIKKTLLDNGLLKDVGDLEAIGHRVVHGGDKFTDAVLVDKDVKLGIKAFSILAPLHNPYNLKGIDICESIFPNSMQVAIFDTSFHNTIPEKAYRYAIPEDLYLNKSIRVYGFHGISHKYVSNKACEYLNNKSSKIISIHLGNGSSISAVKDGRCLDTSMGFSPIGGLIMGTRPGDIDISIISYLMKRFNYDIEQIEDILNNNSGMLAMTGFRDMRNIVKLLDKKDKNAILAYNMYSYRIRKYIGSYISVLNGIDAIVFTGGIGENEYIIREYIFRDMDYFGASIDDTKNKNYNGGIGEIQKDKSKFKIIVIPTDEEMEIAIQTYNVISYK